MASEAPESSRAREEAAEREASQEAAHQQQRPWVALASIAVVYGHKDAGAGALAPGVADVVLDLRHPPRCSYLVLPERLAPDPRHCEPNNFAYVIAVNSDRVLFMASQMATQRRQRNDPDYFLCDVRARTATRLPLVPAELGVKLLPRRSMGLIADPRHPGHYMVAQLNPVPRTSMRRHDSLLCYSTATGQWAVKQLAAAPDHEPWGAHGVFVHDGLLWWVDIAHGMLFCDPFDDNPCLRFVPLPPGSEMQDIGGGVRPPSRLMDQRRCVRPSQGKLRYVEIQGLSYDRAAVNDPPNNPAVLMWTLVNPSALPHWKFEREASFAEIWAHETYIAAGLPQGKVPKLAVVDPSNHDVVYFFQDASLFALGMRDRRVVACEEGFVDHVFQDLGFQFSRFVDAWVLPPTLRVNDPASSDGGGGTKGPDEEEELDVATGSDEELAHLLSQMEINSQPDKEHSLSELLSTVAEDMASPSEPSLEAEAGGQAEEP